MKKFVTISKNILPVDEKKYLKPFLTSTNINTEYWESPPANNMSDTYLTSKLMQIHQLLDMFKSLDIDFKNKNFLDIGTGNAFLPKALLCITNLKSATGADPFQSNENASNHQPDNTDENFDSFIRYVKNFSRKKISYSLYKKYCHEKAEKETFIPQDHKLGKINYSKLKNYNFKPYGAHDLKKLNKKFDLIYCKAIEHIPNWKKVFENLSLVSKKNTIVYFKHRSFFSYLGPHRYASTAIPWGHVLLNDKEYKKYAEKFHKTRSKKMINDFFSNLSYPRNSVSEMTQMMNKYGFSLKCIKVETPPYVKKITKFTNEINNFWKIVNKNYPNLNSDELFSSIHHIVFERN